MAKQPDRWKARQEARENLKGEARVIHALEDIGDTLLGIHHELTELNSQAKKLAAYMRTKR